MSVYLDGLGSLTLEVLTAVAPLVLLAVLYHLFLEPIPPASRSRIVVGIGCTIAGVIFFLHGVHLGFLPAGEGIGHALATRPDRWLLVPLGLWLGLVAALAEPAVRVLGYEVERVSGGSIPGPVLIAAIALGVAVFVSLAMLRVLTGIPLLYILLPGYGLAFLLVLAAPRSIVSMAFDSGGVATGPVIVTFVLAVSVGAARALGDREGLTEGFGLVALVALAPIISVLILGILFGWSAYGGTDELQPSDNRAAETSRRQKSVKDGENA